MVVVVASRVSLSTGWPKQHNNVEKRRIKKLK
jgi:hypothetical protein